MAPLILIKISRSYSEAILKYFLVQALASTILIVSILTGLNIVKILAPLITEVITSVALAIKAGVPPFHFWFPEVSNKLNWTQCFIIFTWQKVAPLILLSITSFSLVSFLILMAVVIGALGGLNQIYIKILLAYSRISHRGWLIIASVSAIKLWTGYFIVYSFLSICIIFSLRGTHLTKISQLSEINFDIILKYRFALNLLSLGGLPPLLGFLAKLSVLAFILKLKLSALALIFIMCSLSSLYYYLRLIYSFVINSETIKPPVLSLGDKYKSNLLTVCTALNILAPILSLAL